MIYTLPDPTVPMYGVDPVVPGQWTCSTRQSTKEKAPSEDSKSCTGGSEARSEGPAWLGFCAEPLASAADETEALGGA